MSWLSDALGVPDTVDDISGKIREIALGVIQGETTSLNALLEVGIDGVTKQIDRLDGATVEVQAKFTLRLK